MRIASSRPAKSVAGGWVHLPGGTVEAMGPLPAPAFISGEVTHLAPIEARDRVYRRLLAAAALSARHQQDLLTRGCSLEEIPARRYATLPARNRAALARRAGAGSDGLFGVPGFWHKDGDRGPYWSVAGSPGLLIPCLDPCGRVRAVRIRVDEPRDGQGK